MRVEIVREAHMQAAGPLGPHTRVFSIGDVVDLPDMHAQLMIAKGEAVLERRRVVKDAATVGGGGAASAPAQPEPKRARKNTKE